MAIIEKLDSITTSKAAIKAAIQEKGVSCDDTLAEYANRIKAIPNPKIESFQEGNYTSNGQDTIYPSDGYDAIKEVYIDVNVRPTSNIEIAGVTLAQGVTFSFPRDKILGVVVCYINGLYSTEESPEIIGYKFRGVIECSGNDSLNSYFVINSDPGNMPIHYWLAKWKETGETVTVTVLQEITITQ